VPRPASLDFPPKEFFMSRSTRLFLPLLVAATVALGGCQTLPGQKIDHALYGEPVSGSFTSAGLADVELPRGMTYEAEKSKVVHAGDLALGEFHYKGRFQSEALADFIDDHMRRTGWRALSRIHLKNHILLFEKRDRVVVATVEDGAFTTHLTLLVVPQGQPGAGARRPTTPAEPPAEGIDQVPLFPEE